MAFVACVSFCLVVVSGTLKTMAGEIVAIWVADGYALGHMMALPRRRWPLMVASAALGGLAANLMGGETLYVAASFTCSGVFEVCVAAWLGPRASTARELTRPRAFVRFVAAAGVLAPLASGLLASVLLHGVFTPHPFSSFSNWVISASLGFVIIGPVSLVFASGEWRSLLEPGHRLRSFLLLAIVGVSATLVFGATRYPLLFWALPPLALLAFQAELATVLLGTLLFMSIAVVLTIHGTGPLWMFHFVTMQERIVGLQLFAIAALSIVLPIAIVQRQRNRLIAMLTEGNRRYRMLAEHADEVVMQLDASGVFEYVSPRARAVLGYEPVELLSRCLLDLVHPDEREQVAAVLAQAVLGEAPEPVKYRLCRRDRSFMWVRSFLAAMPIGPSDECPALALTLRDIDAQVLAAQRRSVEEESLKRLAYVDSLTGLKNRRFFDAEFERRMHAVTPERQLALLFIDVDYFKHYNDCYGHKAGDECLQAVARCISAATRDSDLLARYGGEEFVVLLENCPLPIALKAAERVRSNLEKLAVPHAGSPLGIVTLSVGATEWSGPATSDATQLFDAADAALYEAKRSGRNRVHAARRVHQD